MKTTKRPNTDKRGSVTIDGVTIAWRDGRYMGSDHDDPTDDTDLRGEYTVEVTVESGEIDAIHNAIGCARRLKMLSQFCDVLCPVPGSEHVLRLAGLDDLGGPIWRVVMGDRECDAIPAAQMAHVDPSHYTESGEVATKTIAWMRAVGRVTSVAWHTKDETWHVLNMWDEQTIKAAALNFCQPAAKVITV